MCPRAKPDAGVVPRHYFGMSIYGPIKGNCWGKICQNESSGWICCIIWVSCGNGSKFDTPKIGWLIPRVPIFPSHPWGFRWHGWVPTPDCPGRRKDRRALGPARSCKRIPFSSSRRPRVGTSVSNTKRCCLNQKKRKRMRALITQVSQAHRPNPLRASPGALNCSRAYHVMQMCEPSHQSWVN